MFGYTEPRPLPRAGPSLAHHSRAFRMVFSFLALVR